MRPSSRQTVLEASLRLARRAGLASVTFESVAAESHLSKGGIMYHFASKQELYRAVEEYLASQWEDRLLATLRTPFDESTPHSRLVAYINVAADVATKGDLALVTDSAINNDEDSPWQQVLARWTPSLEVARGTPEGATALVARLAADGLWAFGALNVAPMEPELRSTVVNYLVGLLEQPRDDVNDG